MKSVVLRAPVLTQSGYGVHSRQVARWLMEKARKNEISLCIQCVPWGDTSWYVNPDLEDGFIGEMMTYTSNQSQRFDISFQVILPNEWDLDLGKFNIGITAGVEADRCNPEWIGAADRMDALVFPSNFAAQSFVSIKPSLREKIVIIPESFPDCLQDTQHDKEVFSFDTSFNYLVFGQLTGRNSQEDRKNIFNTIRWICEHHRGEEDVGIILKSNVGRSTILDFKRLQGVVSQTLDSIGREGMPKFYLLHGHLSDEDIKNLYMNPSVKCLATFTRGEGFGLPVLEAAASGLPIIATKWSGYRDFLKGDGYLKVKYKLETVPDSRIDGQIFIKGAQWAQPEEKSAKACLGKIKNHYNIYKKRALDLRQQILKSHSFQAISLQYDKEFGKIL